MRKVTGGFASTSVIVPDQPPSGMSEKSGTRVPDFTRTFAPVCKRIASDGFLGLCMAWYPLEIDSRMRERGFKVGDAGQEDGVRLMMMVGKEDELVPVVLLGTELHEPVKGFGFAGSLHAHDVASYVIDQVLLSHPSQDIGRSEH